MNNRKLIFEDTDLQHNIRLRGFKELVSKANKVKDAYNTLGFGDIDNDTYQTIVSHGYSSVEDKMVNDVNEQLKRVNITIPSIKRNALEDVYKSLNQSGIQSAINSLLSGVTIQPSLVRPPISIPASVLTFSNGEFIIDKGKEDELFEQYTRVYIEGDEDQKLWDGFQNLADTINSQNEVLKSHHLSLIHPLGTMNLLFDVDSNWKVSVKPRALEVLKGSVAQHRTVKHWQEKMAKSQKEDSESRKRKERLIYGDTTENLVKGAIEATVNKVPTTTVVNLDNIIV